MVKVSIIGATGYVGAELIRLLYTHSKVEIVAISSNSFKDKYIDEVYENFLGLNLVCGDEESAIEKGDVIFIALPHGFSEEISKKALNSGKIVIDMGADFRLKNEENYKKWYEKEFECKNLHQLSSYGLTELNRERIKSSKLIANPGCYPTCSILGIYPAINEGIINESNIIIDAKSGLTGAGRTLSLSSHYSQCNEDLTAYALGGSHRHIPEIEENLKFYTNKEVKITFSPQLVPMNRGIFATIYGDITKAISLEEIFEVYKKYYEKEKFINIMPLGKYAKVKNVSMSNYCNISLHVDERTNKLIVCSTIDNMIKGAAGQAVQNMNLILGFREDLGLEALSQSF
ncbi:N-acetyl-gamma-glutamyl-phosphate reductase [Clostridium cavendishii DSM 21758]|uniref:N-acetyl-gamma-glutamyl-phosphate reductase n=1 Tax=Clostridium cavendishii DSM 21758 TaxID=1121302 RepID=A0A1M6EP35_9CLOT|nr:N-acetyl-gamma-glutamyl-phosphate reductase [Clostridium cavendishii]SHI87247.1 N-acetyl-gamma-glutamyl-phosphate reductase [Clostridium cavendishii DSM 21758]